MGLHQIHVFMRQLLRMELSRRKMVSVTGLALLTAGCTTTASNPSLTMEATVASQPGDPFTLDVETQETDITDGSPGKLSVTYQNTADEQATLGLSPAEPHPRTSERDSPGVVLEDPAASIEEADDGFWMPEDDSVSSILGKPQHELAAGEEATAEYQLWAHPQGKPDYAGLEPGTYRVPMPESAALEIVLSEP